MYFYLFADKADGFHHTILFCGCGKNKNMKLQDAQ